MNAEIINVLKKKATPAKFPDGIAYTRLSAQQIKQTAQSLKVSSRDLEIAALSEDIIPERYVRNMRMLSAADQCKLLNAHVGIIGLGGLGGTVTETLARMGIGTLTLIDGDVFEGHNLNRQLLATEETLGTSKAEIACLRVNAVNSSVTVHCHDHYLNELNAGALIKTCDVVVDCLDNIPARFTLEKAAKQLNIPFVAAAVAGITGHVTTIFPQDAGLKLIYGNSENSPPKGAEATLGCLAHAVMIIASIECSEVMKIILQTGSLLRNKLMLVDLTDYTIESLKFQ
jgi:molybdopterin/thiamine biosynthesis adenylyltransferase